MQMMPSFFTVTDSEQLERLNKQLQYASASRYYGQKLCGIGSLRNISETEKLPFLTSEDLIEHGRELLCVRQDDICRIVSLDSSGTSGKRKRLYFSKNDLEQTICFFSEGMQLICGEGNKVAVLFPCRTPEGLGDLLSRGLQRFGAQPLKSIDSAADYSALSEELTAQRPEVIVGAPRVIRLLAILCPVLCPRAVLLSADYVSQSLRSLLHETWDCEVFSHYGMTELGYGGAVESREHGGMLPRRNAMLFEIVNAEGKRAPEGEEGEIVVTKLQSEAMPIIRYRTGDLGIMKDGRLLRTLGRADDRIMPEVSEILDADMCVLEYELKIREKYAEISLLITGNKKLSSRTADSLAKLLPRLRIHTERLSAEQAMGLPINMKKRRTQIINNLD